MAVKTKHSRYCYGNVGEATNIQSKAVFVGYNLPNWITKELLIQLFHSFRDKLDVDRSTIIDAPRNRHGKVFFTESRAVNQAIEQLNGTLLQRKFRLHVKPWVSKTTKRSRLQSEVFAEVGGKRKKYASVNEREQVQNERGRCVSSTNLEAEHIITDQFQIVASDDVNNTRQSSVIAWVGYNLPRKVTECSLREHFHAASDQIERIEFNQTQKCTRVAYIEFTSIEALEQAVSTYNETMMECGQKIWVSKKGEKPEKHTKNPQQSKMCSHRQPHVRTPPRPPFPSNTRPLGVPYPDQQCIPQMGPQYRQSRPPIRPLSSGSHPHSTGPHLPPVPHTYPLGRLSRTTSTKKRLDMSSALYQFITKRFKKDKLTAERAGVRIQFSDGSLLLEGPKSALSEYYESCIRPLEDGSIPITGDQWNMLVTAREDGTLFQNIVKPYQYNPNVFIDKKEDPFTLVIVGYKDAVESARESFLCKLGGKTNTIMEIATSCQDVDTGFNSDGIQLYTPLRSEGHLSDTKEQSTAFSTDSIRDSQNVKLEPLLWTIITSRHMSTLEAEDCKVMYSKESPGVFEVLGKKEAVQSVVTKIAGIEADLKSKLCCETVEVDKCFQFSLNEQSILSFVKSVEKKCFVKIDLPRSNTVLWESTGPTSNPQIVLSGDKAGSSDVPDVVYQWEFMDDDGKFQPFEQKLGSQVENKYLRNPKSEFGFSHGKWSYSVNLDSMTQTNKETGKSRIIKRSMYIPSWYWEDDDGTYHPYSQAVSAMIDQIQNGTIKNQVDINGRCYMFDFSAKHQVDISTGHKRKMKPRTLTIQVNGCIEDVHVAKKKITEFFKNIEKEDKFQFPLEFSSKMEPLIATSCTRHSVKVSFQGSSENVSVTFHGWEKAVSLVKEQCMKELLDLMNEHNKITVKHPDEWEPDDNTFVMKNVSRTSREFKKVLTRMHETIPDVTIKKLQRIQNQWLWEKYAQHHTRIHKKNQGKIEEKDLFHGTRGTDPSLIYDGEEGFDMRFCRGGKWGVGNYFAVDASYSDSYAYHVSGGVYQMFLARVITGESYCSHESKRDLRMPPKKPCDKNFADERYDSVTGTTEGSQVFVVYDNLKAYPLYLITYYEL